MKKNTGVIFKGLNFENTKNNKIEILIDLLSQRNFLIKKYPQFTAYLKYISHQYGLYIYQAKENSRSLPDIAHLGIFGQLGQQEITGCKQPVVMTAEIIAFSRRLDAMFGKRPENNVRYNG
jgi:hypothetical protein